MVTQTHEKAATSQFVVKESGSVSMDGSFVSQRAKFNVASLDAVEAAELAAAHLRQRAKPEAAAGKPGEPPGSSAREAGAAEDEGLCSICFSEAASTVLLDCGHGGICLACAIDSMKKNNHCLFCRERVVQIIEIDTQDLGNGLFKVVNSYYVSDGKHDA